MVHKKFERKYENVVPEVAEAHPGKIHFQGFSIELKALFTLMSRMSSLVLFHILNLALVVYNVRIRLGYIFGWNSRSVFIFCILLNVI